MIIPTRQQGRKRTHHLDSLGIYVVHLAGADEGLDLLAGLAEVPRHFGGLGCILHGGGG